MSLLEIESGPATDLALRVPAARPDRHTSTLTVVTVTRTDEDLDAKDGTGAMNPSDELDDVRLRPLPRLSDLMLTVVQTDSDGNMRRWRGAAAAGAGIPTGPGAVLHLQPAASLQSAAGERRLAIQAERDRRPNRDNIFR